MEDYVQVAVSYAKFSIPLFYLLSTPKILGYVQQGCLQRTGIAAGGELDIRPPGTAADALLMYKIR